MRGARIRILRGEHKNIHGKRHCSTWGNISEESPFLLCKWCPQQWTCGWMEDCCLGFAAVISRPFLQFALYSSLIWAELDHCSHVPERQLVTRVCERPQVFFLQHGALSCGKMLLCGPIERFSLNHGSIIIFEWLNSRVIKFSGCNL